jgi:hypothetical protein
MRWEEAVQEWLVAVDNADSMEKSLDDCFAIRCMRNRPCGLLAHEYIDKELAGNCSEPHDEDTCDFDDADIGFERAAGDFLSCTDNKDASKVSDHCVTILRMDTKTLEDDDDDGDYHRTSSWLRK